MRIVVLAFHPALTKSRVNGAWAQAAEAAGHTVRDLYALYPHGAPDVAVEQAAVEDADVLCFQHPFNWYSCPWLMKRWIDDVLTYGWAYGGPDRLAGKKWLSAISVGAGAEEYSAKGSRGHAIEEFLIPFARTAAFCGMEYLEPYLLFGSGYATEEVAETSATQFVARLASL